MKSILISDKPKWCALMMNGIKKIEVRKNKALASAIQKLIDEYGYADIYVYCSKDGYNHLHELADHSTDETLGYSTCYYEVENVRGWDIEPAPLNGKVVFKFRCYKVEEYVNGCKLDGDYSDYEHILKPSCLTEEELYNYCEDLSFNAIHISDLEVFGRPQELCEFHTNIKKEPPEELLCPKCGKPMEYYEYKYLTKAPQNFTYINIDKGELELL